MTTVHEIPEDVALYLERRERALGEVRILLASIINFTGDPRDIDPDAATNEVPFFIASVNAVRDNAFDVVVANINEDVIGKMRPDLERVAKTRILSGFQDEEGNWTCVIR